MENRRNKSGIQGENMNKIYISWEDTGLMLENLVGQILQSGKRFDGVYGVPRGGLPIAVYLSHHLNLPMLMHPSRDSLVCDDISDTGKTLQSYRNRTIATLYSTKWTKAKPDFFVELKKRKDDWVVFPWENYEKERRTD